MDTGVVEPITELHAALSAGWLAGNPAAAAAAETEYVAGKPMVSEKEKRAAVS